MTGRHAYVYDQHREKESERPGYEPRHRGSAVPALQRATANFNRAMRPLHASR